MEFEKLGSLAIIIMGQSPKKEEVNRFRKGLPLLNGPTEFGEYCPIPVQFTEYPKKIAPKGSLLFCVRGSTTGRMNWADQDYAIGRGLATIIPNDTRMGEYLRNSINYNLEYLLSSATGSTFPNVSANLLGSFPVQIVQNTVEASNLLDVISKKKLVNEQSIYKLEQLAQTLFKRWFVDFEFPNENGEPYKSSGGEMAESELGRIPYNWSAGTLNDVAIIGSGKRPKLKSNNRSYEASIPIIGASKIMGYTNEKLFNKPIVVTGRVGTHGVIQRHDYPCWPSDNTLVIESDYLEYVYQFLNTVNFKSLNRGSTQPLITQGDVKGLKLSLAPKEELKRFEKEQSTFGKMISNKKVENNKLEVLRDTLLPKLLSGEIELPNESEVTENVPIS